MKRLENTVGKTFRANDDNAYKYRKAAKDKKNKKRVKTSYLDDNTQENPVYNLDLDDT